MFLPWCERPSCIPIKGNRQNYSFVYISFIFLDSKLETKDSAPNDSKHSLTCMLLVSS